MTALFSCSPSLFSAEIALALLSAYASPKADVTNLASPDVTASANETSEQRNRRVKVLIR